MLGICASGLWAVVHPGCALDFERKAVGTFECKHSGNALIGVRRGAPLRRIHASQSPFVCQRLERETFSDLERFTFLDFERTRSGLGMQTFRQRLDRYGAGAS
jgi:hypothetical protein